MTDPLDFLDRMTVVPPLRIRQKRKAPEQSLQQIVAAYFHWALPPNVYWTAVGHGGGGALRGAILKGMGVKAGAPDLLLISDGRAFLIELKAEHGTLSQAQLTAHTMIRSAGAQVEVCRSLDKVRDQLAIWRISTRETKPATAAIIRAFGGTDGS